MAHPIIFGLIGCGRISRRHAASMQMFGRLAAVCDTDLAAAEDLSAGTGATAYASPEALLAAHPEIQVVAVCSPNGYHAEHAIKCLQAGKHVLCEKPLCIDSRAGRQVLETARLCRRNIWVVKAARFYPAVAALKKAIGDGKMGRILSFQLNCCWNRPVPYYENTWRGSAFPDGGVLYTQFSHYIDALWWLAGKPLSISGFRTNFIHRSVIEAEDSGVAALYMENGALGTVHWTVNATSSNMEISLLLVGEKATVQLGGNNMQEPVYQVWDDPHFLLPSPSIPVPVHDRMYGEIAGFLEGRGAGMLTSGYEALASVELIEQIYENCSLLNRSPVQQDTR